MTPGALKRCASFACLWLAGAVVGSVSLAAFGQSRSSYHAPSAGLHFEGFKMGAVRTADTGATIAQAVVHGTQVVDARPASTELVLQQPCDIKNGFARFRLNAGPVAESSFKVSTTPPVVLVPVETIDSLSKSAAFAGVYPDGTIDQKLWMKSVSPGHFMHAWFGHAHFSPANCHFTPIPVPASPARVDQFTYVDYDIVYMGRDSSGFLKFAAVRPQSSYSAQELVPAQPGTYNLHGLELRVLDVEGFKLTYTVVFGGSPDGSW